MKHTKNMIKPPAKKLTRREIEVLTLTALGQRPGQLSQALSLSVDTVREYIENARCTLGAVNNTHAAVLAVVLGLILPYETKRTKKVGK